MVYRAQERADEKPQAVSSYRLEWRTVCTKEAMY